VTPLPTLQKNNPVQPLGRLTPPKQNWKT
jgi:hypothetical protein